MRKEYFEELIRLNLSRYGIPPSLPPQFRTHKYQIIEREGTNQICQYFNAWG